MLFLTAASMSDMSENPVYRRVSEKLVREFIDLMPKFQSMSLLESSIQEISGQCIDTQ
jgi:hypothetical protein